MTYTKPSQHLVDASEAVSWLDSDGYWQHGFGNRKKRGEVYVQYMVDYRWDNACTGDPELTHYNIYREFDYYLCNCFSSPQQPMSLDFTAEMEGEWLYHGRTPMAIAHTLDFAQQYDPQAMKNATSTQLWLHRFLMHHQSLSTTGNDLDHESW